MCNRRRMGSVSSNLLSTLLRICAEHLHGRLLSEGNKAKGEFLKLAVHQYRDAYFESEIPMSTAKSRVMACIRLRLIVGISLGLSK